MAKWIPDIVQQEKEAIKRKEQAARGMTNALQNLRDAAAELRTAADAVMEVFNFARQSDLSDAWQMTGTEKRIAFDDKLIGSPTERTDAPNNGNDSNGMDVAEDGNIDGDSNDAQPVPADGQQQERNW